jgi:hypothetical protein
LGAKGFLTVNELAAVGLGAANGDYFTQRGKPQLFQLFFFLEPQTFPQNFTCVW